MRESFCGRLQKPAILSVRPQRTRAQGALQQRSDNTPDVRQRFRRGLSGADLVVVCIEEAVHCHQMGQAHDVIDMQFFHQPLLVG